MVAYDKFYELSQSGDSEKRGQAAHLAALAYVEHNGRADENAALYASLISFLDDDSVKVRAALAYGLLHAKNSPRPIMMSLLHDEPIIARAIAQYSPVLVDADLVAIIKVCDVVMLEVISQRKNLSQRIAHSLLKSGDVSIILKVLERKNIVLCADHLHQIAVDFGDNPKIRGALFLREELHGNSRYMLIEKVSAVLGSARIVKGAITAHRLKRLMRDSESCALTNIGESQASMGQDEYAKNMVSLDQVNARLLLHSVVNGHVLFFTQCVSLVAKIPQEKIFSLLNNGSRAALNALFSKVGLDVSLRNLLARLIFYARTADLADDIAARHYIVTAMIDEMLIEHGGDIPTPLEEAFAYLNEQNIMLARDAARGVMGAFVSDDGERVMLSQEDQALALPAA
jgi:uncharacterized protein (DUF2336 family)